MFRTRTLIVRRLGIWALGISSIIASTSAMSSKPCRLHERLPEVKGRWIQTKEVVRAGGYAEANCPDFVHVTDCLRQSGNPAKTAAEYRYLFQPDNCALHRYNGRQAAACLRNKRLILIGDSMAWSQFESLACMLGPGAIAVNGTRMMSAEHFMQWQDSRYRGDLLLAGNASVHMRGINKFDDGERWRKWLRDLGGLSSSDILIVNWGSHYTLHGSFEDYKQGMQRIILEELRQLPCQIYWREYSPTHFGGPSGKFTHDPSVKVCAPAETGETEYNDWIQRLLAQCGAACAHIKLLPIWGASLGRYGSHAGDHIPEKKFGFWVKAVRHDCRHFCLNVVDVWNQILLNMICSPAAVQAPILRNPHNPSIAH